MTVGCSGRVLRLAVLLLALGVAFPAGARELPTAAAVLTLDRDRPFVTAVVAGRTLRLAVDLNLAGSIVVDPAVAARLPLRFVPDEPLEIGRALLPGRAAQADVQVGGVTVRTHLYDYGRPCCMGADGAIGLDLLPYAEVKLVRPYPGPLVERGYTLATADPFGRYVARPSGNAVLAVRFSIVQPQSDATAAGGSLLLREAGGVLDDAVGSTVSLFGVVRPTRLLRLARPVDLAGFPFDRLPVRTADLRGRNPLPSVRGAPGDLVVRGREPRQRAWPAVTLGGDRLDHCPLITYRRADARLALGCRA